MKHRILLTAAVLGICGLFAEPSLALPLAPAGGALPGAQAKARASVFQTVGHRYYIKRRHAYGNRGPYWGRPGHGRWAYRGRNWPRYAGCWNCGRHWRGYQHYYPAPYWAYGYPYYGYDFPSYGYGYRYPYYGYGYGYPGVSVGIGFSFH